VVRDIRDHIRRLKTSPFIGSPVSESGQRALHHYPYLIHYEVDEARSAINLISIPHGSQESAENG
jgi:plasmid stabilization system protein ParE